MAESLTVVFRENLSRTSLSALETFGRLVALAIESALGSVADVLARRFQWRETVNQAWYLIKVTAIPAVLMAVPFGVVVSIQVGNLIHQLGADSMLGAAGGLGIIQQGAPLSTGLLLGGAGAATIAADLGARTIREEIAALRTMGINPVNRLVIPRMVAMLFVAPLLNVLIIFVGVLSGFLVATAAQGLAPGSYWATFGAFASLTDVAISLIKAVIFGFLVVIIGCQRGLEAKGGPRGVADGVNASVVLSVVAIALVNVGITQLVSMFHPMKVA